MINKYNFKNTIFFVIFLLYPITAFAQYKNTKEFTILNYGKDNPIFPKSKTNVTINPKLKGNTFEVQKSLNLKGATQFYPEAIKGQGTNDQLGQGTNNQFKTRSSKRVSEKEFKRQLEELVKSEKKNSYQE